jgi:formylmethanofuran dehydrogenase subunit C
MHSTGGGGIYFSSGSKLTAQRVALMRLNAGSSVTVNGERITGPCTVEVRDGVLYLDGKAREKKKEEEGVRVEIHIVGNVVDTGGILLDAGMISVMGDVTGPIRTASGDVSIGGALKSGSITTMSGDVVVHGNVSGGVATMSGDVTVAGTTTTAKSDTGSVIRRNQHRHRYDAH